MMAIQPRDEFELGFALLGSLRPKPAVIFVTAFDHYAVRAFEEQAQDYLMKPFRQERLAEALERVHRSAIANLDHAAALEELLGLRLFHPDEEERFMAFLASETNRS